MGLEAQLLNITEDFVSRIVEVIQRAPFLEVAAYGRARNGRSLRQGHPSSQPVQAPLDASGDGTPKRRGRKPRQTQEKRAELSERVLAVLRGSPSPLGVRAIASQAGIAADLLGTPLRELRQEGKIRKHGEKRNTTYSIA